MKKNAVLVAFLLAVVVQIFSMNAYGQRRLKYIPDNGFRVLTGNKSNKHITTVQFYNNNEQLMYAETVANIKFNVNKVKTLRWLKQGSDKALVAFNQNPKPLKDSSWMAVIVRN